MGRGVILGKKKERVGELCLVMVMGGILGEGVVCGMEIVKNG